MPKSLIIQTIIGIIIAVIAMALFVFSVITQVTSTEYHQIETDGTVRITPEPGRVYFISVESAHELTEPELESIHRNLVVTSNDPFGGFALNAAPTRSRSSRTHMSNTTHTASVSSVLFTDKDAITLNINPAQAGPGRTLMIESGDDLTVIGFVAPVLLFLIGLGAGIAASIRFFIWMIKKPESSKRESQTPSVTG